MMLQLFNTIHIARLYTTKNTITHYTTITMNTAFRNTRMVRYDRWIRNRNLKAIPHQRKAVEWALEREARRHVDDNINGGIIADEMGLGKTYMMLGTIISNPNPGLTLIVVPPALLEQWKEIIGKYLSNENGFLIVYHGAKARTILLEEQVLIDNGTRIVLTTYGMMARRKPKRGQRTYVSPIWNVNWYRTVYDEAHHMRNSRSNNWFGAKLTPCSIRWLMTGTPIQNYKSDVHSLIRLIDPLRTIQDLCLHRTKKDVGIQLPPINTHYVEVEPRFENESSLIHQIHSRLPFADVTLENVDRYIEMFEGKGIFPILTAARQACLYPRLLIDRWIKLLANGDIDGDIELPSVNTHSKLDAIVDTINGRDKTKQKIIFTHYYGEIDRLQALLTMNGYKVGKIDGRTKKKERNNLLNSNGDKLFNALVLNRLFNGQQCDVRNKIQEYLAGPDILLLQIKSCCEGLNLQSYREIYFTSPHWNPATEDQAIARAHRIGQTKPVEVFKFVTKLIPSQGERPNYSLDDYCLFIQRCKRLLMEQLREESTTQL